MKNQLHGSLSAKVELLLTGVFCVLGFVISSWFDLFERFVAWSVKHDGRQADELATALIVFAFCAAIFAWRRWNELSAEVGRRQGAEEALRRNEASFKQIVDQAGDLIYQNDDHGLFTFCNPTTHKVLKYAESDLLRMHYLDLVRPDCRLEVDQFYRRQMIDGAQETYKEIPVITKDGEELLLGLKVQLLREAGRIVGFQTLARDITEDRRAEEKALQMQEYQSLFRLANDAILVLDAEDGTILDATDKACETYGIVLEEFIGRNLRDITNDPVGAESRLVKMCTGEKLEPFETVHHHADGTPITFMVSASLIEYRNRRAILDINRDITEQKRAAREQSRLQGERDQLLEQLQLQMEFMPIAFVLTDPDLLTTHWNPAAERIFGFTKEEVLGKSSHLLIVPEDSQPFVEQIFERIATGEVISATNDNVTKDGRRITCDWHSAPLKRPDGTFVGIMSMAQDITERKQAETTKAKLEAQLVQSQKLEAIGTLAGGIAHDFNNILAASIGYCELALMDVDDSAMEGHLNQILKAGNRAKELVRQILTFSRQEELEKKPIELQSVIDESLRLLRASLPSSIEIRQSIDAAAPAILGDSTQIHQVLMNLCTNAWHAMAEHGGVMEISLTTVEVDLDFANAHPGLKQGTHVRLVISDTGKGMDSATVERIFEPFFTTKPPGSGTGLGLAVVHGIIKQFGGTISVYSEVAQGTTFSIYLPTHDHAATPAPASSFVPRGNGEHILFVDDEESLASVGKSMLERLGYRVTTEIGSIEGLKAFRAKPHDFDLVITDQTMPHLSGADFAKVLLEIRPQLPVILSTGYSTTINREKAQAIGIREFLLKPNTAQSLGEAIHRALSANRKD